ncbi:MAG: hypothetical protein HKP10_07645, partial [Kiritimatiellales bacterium]|nr:hypothetical protein [Kiritimatiellales bacterium]
MEITHLVESFKFRFQASAIDNAQRVAEELLAHVFDCKPLEIYTKALLHDASTREKADCIRKLEPLAQRIEAGEPLQYVIGHVDFWGLQLKC